jgi:DNA replication protein DnaD
MPLNTTVRTVVTALLNDDERILAFEYLAFFDWLETNSVGASCICLWMALLHTWHKARYPVEFAVAVSTLEGKTGLKKDAIYKARNKLQQTGRVTWSERTGRQSAVYKYIPFYNAQIFCVGLTDANSNTNSTQTEADPIKHYEKLFGLVRPMVYEEIRTYMSEGLATDLICIAMDRSHENGAYNWLYAKRILDRCTVEKVYTVKEFILREERHRIEKANKRAKKGGDFSNDKHGGNTDGEQQYDAYSNIPVGKL